MCSKSPLGVIGYDYLDSQAESALIDSDKWLSECTSTYYNNTNTGVRLIIHRIHEQKRFVCLFIKKQKILIKRFSRSLSHSVVHSIAIITNCKLSLEVVHWLYFILEAAKYLFMLGTTLFSKGLELLHKYFQTLTENTNTGHLWRISTFNGNQLCWLTELEYFLKLGHL